jgi:peptide/nickel transport system substrate-binding protein
MSLHQVYENLVDRSIGYDLEPQLAVAWKLVEPTVWEFQLREGVRFHDGTPFSAQDVVFSIERVRHEAADASYQENRPEC